MRCVSRQFVLGGKSSVAVVLMSMFAVGCGGPAAQIEASEPVAPVTFEPPEQSMTVTGTLGTIPQRKIHQVLEARLGRFQRCFAKAAQRVEFIGGEVELAFVVDTRGHVTSVHLKQSNVGDRETERCVLEIAAEAQFPEPKGGEGAEFTWGFAMDAPPDVRPPVVLDGSRVARENPEVLAAVTACNPEPLEVTAYVDRGGKPMAAGVSTATFQAPSVLDCVSEAVVSHTLPDPGSYPGKLTFRAP